VKVGLGLGLVGLVAWGTRWALQGGLIVYTDVSRSFWVADPTLGWVETADSWVWLGLDGAALLGVVVIGAAFVTWFGHRGRGSKIESVARVLSKFGALLAAAGPVLPVWAFVSGMPPEGAERLMPDVAAVTPSTEQVSPLPVPGGRWKVVDSPSNLLVARIAAGGETFDGKFGPVKGEATLDINDLTKSIARFEVPAESVSTGVALRDDHARGYLGVETHKTIALTISGFKSVSTTSPEARSVKGDAKLDIMGKTLDVPLEGTIAALDAAARTKLAVTAPEALLVSASFKLGVVAAGLNRANFDADDITLNVRFVMVAAP
jgi:polyisoprenoid-binding protein YceI